MSNSFSADLCLLQKQQALAWAETLVLGSPTHFGDVTAEAVKNESEVSEERRRFSPGWLGVGRVACRLCCDWSGCTTWLISVDLSESSSLAQLWRVC